LIDSRMVAVLDNPIPSVRAAFTASSYILKSFGGESNQYGH